MALNVKSRDARSASIPSVERREVDRLVDALDDDSPRAVPLGERERRAAEASREAMRRVARIRARDVDVENRPEEQRVTNRAADDPGVLAAQDLAESLIHRSRPVVHAQSRVLRPVAIS